MHIHRSHFAILFSTFCLAACAGIPPHEALPLAARDKISSTEIVMPIKQSEIYVFVPDSQIAAAGGGGLLLALIDAGVNDVRTSKAEAAVKPLRDATVDFDFDGTLRDDVKSSLSAVPWLHVSDARVVRDISPDGMDSVFTGSSAGAILFATTDYHLSNDADTLTVTMNASLFGKDAALADLKAQAKDGAKTQLSNSLYHNTLVYQTTTPATGPGDRNANIAAWSANNGSLMRANLTKAAAKLASMLADDIQQPEGPDVPQTTNEPDGSLTRTSTGTLSFIAPSVF